MDCRLLDRNTISIISSPNKEFYRMAAVDLSDGELSCDVNNVESLGNRSNQITRDNVKNSCDAFKISYCDGQLEGFLESRISKSDSVESFDCTPRNSRDSVNSSPRDASLSFSDASSLSIGSEVVFDGDDAVIQSSCTSEEKPSDYGKDVTQADSLTDLFNPIHMQKVHHKSEGHLNTHLAKSRRSLRRSRKSKSVQNNSSSAGSKFRRELFAETPTSAYNNLRKGVFSENYNSSELKCRGVWKSPSLTDHLADHSMNWKSQDNTVDVESSANENGFLTSDSTKMTSTGQESTNVDQIWDEYQVPLYEGISDDSTEGKLDASCLQGDWQPLTDEYGNLSDFGIDSTIHHQRDHFTSDEDVDTDAEDLQCIMVDSYKALRLTKASLADQIRSGNQTGQNSRIKELMATCETNVTCLKNLFDVVDQRDWDVHDVSDLSELLTQWKDVESQLLTSCQELSNSKLASDVIIDLSTNDDVIIDLSTDDDVTVSKETTSLRFPEVNVDESAGCPTQTNRFLIPNRFNVFGSKLYNLLDESSLALQSTLMSIQPLFFVLFILLIAYLFIYRRCFGNVMDIRFEPQLRYVFGPPPA